MSDTSELMKIEGRPGWRYDADTGQALYSAGWLNDGVGESLAPPKRHLSVARIEEEQ